MEWVDAQYAGYAHLSDVFHCVKSWFVLLALLLSTAQIVMLSQGPDNLPGLIQRKFLLFVDNVSTPCCTIMI